MRKKAEESSGSASLQLQKMKILEGNGIDAGSRQIEVQLKVKFLENER